MDAGSYCRGQGRQALTLDAAVEVVEGGEVLQLLTAVEQEQASNVYLTATHQHYSDLLC